MAAYGTQKETLLEIALANTGRYRLCDPNLSKNGARAAVSYISNRKYFDGKQIIEIPNWHPRLAEDSRSFGAQMRQRTDGRWRVVVKFLQTVKSPKFEEKGRSATVVESSEEDEFDSFTTAGVLQFIKDGLDPNWDFDASRPNTGRYRRKK